MTFTWLTINRKMKEKTTVQSVRHVSPSWRW